MDALDLRTGTPNAWFCLRCLSGTLILHWARWANADMHALDTCLWLAGSLLCATTLLVGLCKRRVDRLPAFSFYLGLAALTNPIGLAIRSPRVFEWFVFSVSIAGFALELAVIYELANKVLLSHSSLAKVFGTAPRWSASVLFLLVTLLGALLPQHARTLALQAYSTLSLSLNLMDLALILGLLLTTRFFGLSWGIVPAGAALGIAITDAGCAVGAVLLAQFGHPRFFVDFIRLGSFDVAGLIWLISVCFVERKIDASKASLQISSVDHALVWD